jgi:hypothetical protein
MTIEEYKTLYPRNEIFIQVDNSEQIMTIEEYEIWVTRSVYNENHPLLDS